MVVTIIIIILLFIYSLKKESLSNKKINDFINKHYVKKKLTTDGYKEEHVYSGDYEGADVYIYGPKSSRLVPFFSKPNAGLYFENNRLGF